MARPFLATVLLLTVSLAGCAGTEEGGDGSASVYVKDAPADDFAELHVVFTEVRVHAAGGEGDGDEGQPDDADPLGDEGEDGAPDSADGNATGDSEADGNSTAGWRVVFESSSGVDVDLLNASGRRAAFLGEADLPAGRYTQIRVVVTEAYGVTHNGSRVDIEVSSGTLKLVQAFTVEAGMESRIVLDIDLERALHQQGNGAWRLTPVIGNTVVDVVEDGESGEEAAQEGEVVELEGDSAE